MNYELGIDVSSNQWLANSRGKIDFTKPPDFNKPGKLGAKFAIVRATIGNYRTDPCFIENYLGYQDAGLEMYIYFVAVPADRYGKKITAAQHIEYLWKALLSLPTISRRSPWEQPNPIAIDCELHCNQTPQVISALIGQLAIAQPSIEDSCGMIYTSAWFWNKYVLRSTRWKNYKLWVANYTMREQPTMPRDWKYWYIWQYSADRPPNLLGKEFGVHSSSIDLNRRKAIWQQ